MMFPTTTQIAAYKNSGYLLASSRFDILREQFEHWCDIDATPLVIIWPPVNRRRRVTMQLFNCTALILDEQFQEEVRNLARIWRASNWQTQRLPVSFDGMTLCQACALAEYLHEPAIEAYKRRAERVKIIAWIDHPASDGKPKKTYGLFSGSCVYPVKSQRSFTCALQLDNGEIYQGGLIGGGKLERDHIKQLFADKPSWFRLLNVPKKVG